MWLRTFGIGPLQPRRARTPTFEQFPQTSISDGHVGIDGGVTTVHGQSTVDANLCGHQVHLTGTAATGFVDLDQPRALVYALRVINDPTMAS